MLESIMTYQSNQRGSIAIAFAILLPVLIGFIGLAIDVGYLYYVKLQMQTAADAGAISGALQVQQGFPGSVSTNAINDVALNGFVSGQSSVNVTVFNGPSSGPHASDPNFVEVLVKKEVPVFFIPILYNKPFTINTRAVAGFSSGSPTCIYTLNPSATDASFQATSTSEGMPIRMVSANVQMPDCGIAVNSSSSNGFMVDAASTVAAHDIAIVGGKSASGGVTPIARVGAVAAVDPLKNYVMPTFGVCSFTEQQVIEADATLSPGVYCGGILIKNQVTIRFSPGTYYLVGGGIANTDNATLLGEGVTFVNTQKAGYPYGAVNLGSDGTLISLSAPTDGLAKDILFYQEPSIAVGSTASNLGGGLNTLMKLTGVIYFPTTSLRYQVGSTLVMGAGTHTFIVSYNLAMTGANRINYQAAMAWPVLSGPVALAE